MFSDISPEGTSSSPGNDMYDLLQNCGSSASLTSSIHPHKSSDVLVVGRAHEFAEDERKIRIPVFCSYCDGMLQRKLVLLSTCYM